MRNVPNIPRFCRMHQVRKSSVEHPSSTKTNRNRLERLPEFFIILNALLFLTQRKLLVPELNMRLFSIQTFQFLIQEIE